MGGKVVELDEGYYRVVIHSMPLQEFDEIEVRAEFEVSLELR